MFWVLLGILTYLVLKRTVSLRRFFLSTHNIDLFWLRNKKIKFSLRALKELPGFIYLVTCPEIDQLYVDDNAMIASIYRRYLPSSPKAAAFEVLIGEFLVTLYIGHCAGPGGSELDPVPNFTVIILPSADPFKKGCCQIQANVCARITGPSWPRKKCG